MSNEPNEENDNLEEEEEEEVKKEPIQLYDKASFISKLLSLWIWPFLWTGFRKTLKPEDIPRVPKQYDTNRVYFRYARCYEKVKDTKRPLFLSIMRFMWKKFLTLEILSVSAMAIQLSTPFIQRVILENLFPDENTSDWIRWRGTGFIFVGILFIACLIKMYLTKLSGELSNNVRVTLMNALTAKVYNKLLHFSSKSLAEMSNQSFLTFVNVEIGLVVYFPIALFSAYKQPIMLIASVILLYVNLSWPAFFIIAVIVIVIPIYMILSVLMFVVFMKIIKIFSENTKFTGGVLRGIRVIKTNVWENVFLEKIMKKRKKFVYFVILYFVLIIMFSVTSSLSPVVMQIVLFSVTFTYQKENFTISKIFPSLSYIMFFSEAITALPSLLIAAGKGFMSMLRVEKLLMKDEFNESFYSTPYDDEKGETEDEDDDHKKKKKKKKDDDDDDSSDSEHEENDENRIVEYPIIDPDEYPVRMWNGNFEWYPKPETKGKMNMMGGGSSSGDGSGAKGKSKKGGKICQSCIGKCTSCFHLLSKLKKKKKKNKKGEKEENSESVEMKMKKTIGKLKNIDLKVKKGSLVALIGEVGSGKTMILKSIIGELKKKSGWIDVNGSVSYVAQDPWVINATVEQNILFGAEKDEEKYIKSIKACDLEKDIGLFPDGDLTEVGERGITLSGGQKQRIALARGFYQSSDVYLLDDISSAVDPGVAKIIFEKGICGVIRDRTRLLVTNQLSWLVNVDYIIALEEGKIKEEGEYEDLMMIEDGFVKYLVEKFTSVQEQKQLEEEDDEMKNIKKKEEEEEDDEDDDSEEDEKAEEIIVIEEEEKKNDQNEDDVVLSSGINVVVSDTTEDPQEEKEQEKTKKDEEEEKKKGKVVGKGKGKGTGLMMKEEIKEGQVGLRTIWFYFSGFGITNCWFSAVVTLTFLAIITLFHFVYKQMLQVWLSFWTTRYFDISDTLYLIIYASIGITQPAFGTCRYFLLIVFSLCSGVRITRKVFRRLMSTSISYWERTPLGRVMNRLSGDQFKTDFLITSLNGFIRTIFALVFSLITVGVTNWFSLILIVFIVPVYIFIQEFYRRSSRQVRRIQAVSRSPMIAFLQETVDGIHRIRTYKAQPHFFKRFCDKINENTKVSFMEFQLGIWLSFVLENVTAIIIIVCGMLIVGFKDLPYSGVSVLAGLSFSHLLSFSNKLKALVQQVVAIEQNFNSVERLSVYANELETESATQSVDKPSKKWASSNKGFTIEFENIGMKYRPELPFVLQNLSFQIQPCEKVGIVGRSGCGKTSLFNVLFRINEPCEGTFFIDEREVTKDAGFGLHDLRSCMSIIPQDPYLFKGTVKFNLDPEQRVRKDSELWDVLAKCRLKKTVEAYDEKLNHEIDGTKMSAGEKQLFCLARSLIRKTKILCLDEATANIDLETETFIRDTIDQEFEDCIVLTIAHRIHTIAKSDRVMVLESGGKLVEFDKPIHLASDTNSSFYKILDDLGEENKQKLLEIMKGKEDEENGVVEEEILEDFKYLEPTVKNDDDNEEEEEEEEGDNDEDGDTNDSGEEDA